MSNRRRFLTTNDRSSSKTSCTMCNLKVWLENLGLISVYVSKNVINMKSKNVRSTKCVDCSSVDESFLIIRNNLVKSGEDLLKEFVLRYAN